MDKNLKTNNLKIEVESISPTQYKSLKSQSLIEYAFYPSPFGEVILAVTQGKICYLNFVLKDYATSLKELAKFWNKSQVVFNKETTQNFADVIVNNKPQNLTVLLKGTDFQISVWKELLRIPCGQLSTYKQVAHNLNSKALRAVGTAIGHNPIAYLVPCHRVINSNGEFGNYGGGKERKVKIIEFERVSLY